MHRCDKCCILLPYAVDTYNRNARTNGGKHQRKCFVILCAAVRKCGLKKMSIALPGFKCCQSCVCIIHAFHTPFHGKIKKTACQFCPCPNSPSTNTTILCFVIAISGEPGGFLQLRRYRMPLCQSFLVKAASAIPFSSLHSPSFWRFPVSYQSGGVSFVTPCRVTQCCSNCSLIYVVFNQKHCFGI